MFCPPPVGLGANVQSNSGSIAFYWFDVLDDKSLAIAWGQLTDVEVGWPFRASLSQERVERPKEGLQKPPGHVLGAGLIA